MNQTASTMEVREKKRRHTCGDMPRHGNQCPNDDEPKPILIYMKQNRGKTFLNHC